MVKTHDTKAPERPADAWQWQLADRRVARMAPAAQPRWLVVAAGTLWLTPTAAEGDAVPDAWLSAGQRLVLPAGSEWVAEARGEARFEVLEPPAGPGGGAAAAGALVQQRWRGLSRAIGDWTRRWSLAAAPCCGA